MVMWAGTAGKPVFTRSETAQRSSRLTVGGGVPVLLLRVTRGRSCVWFPRSPVFRCAAAWSGDGR